MNSFQPIIAKPKFFGPPPTQDPNQSLYLTYNSKFGLITLILIRKSITITLMIKLLESMAMSNPSSTIIVPRRKLSSNKGSQQGKQVFKGSQIALYHSFQQHPNAHISQSYQNSPTNNIKTNGEDQTTQQLYQRQAPGTAYQSMIEQNQQIKTQFQQNGVINQYHPSNYIKKPKNLSFITKKVTSGQQKSFINDSLVLANKLNGKQKSESLNVSPRLKKPSKFNLDNQRSFLVDNSNSDTLIIQNLQDNKEGNRPNTAAVNNQIHLPLTNNLTSVSTPASPKHNRLSFQQQVHQKLISSQTNTYHSLNSNNNVGSNAKGIRPNSQNNPLHPNFRKPSQLHHFKQSPLVLSEQQEEELTMLMAIEQKKNNINIAASPPSIQTQPNIINNNNSNNITNNGQAIKQNQNNQVLNILKQMNINKVTPGKDGNIKFGGKLQTIDHYKTFEKDKHNLTIDQGLLSNHQYFSNNDSNPTQQQNSNQPNQQKVGVSTQLLRSYDFRQNNQKQMKIQVKQDQAFSDDDHFQQKASTIQSKLVVNPSQVRRFSNNYVRVTGGPQTQQNSPDRPNIKFIQQSYGKNNQGQGAGHGNNTGNNQQRQNSLNSSQNNHNSPNSSGIGVNNSIIINDQEKNVVYKKASSYFSQPSSPKHAVRPISNKQVRNNSVKDQNIRQSQERSKQKKEIPEQVQLPDDRYNVITKFAFATTVGYMPGNPHKQNQDSFALTPNMGGIQGLHFFAVSDGHGVNGHHVSGYIKEKLSNQVLEQFKKLNGMDQFYFSKNNKSEFHSMVPYCLKQSFIEIHRQLAKQNFEVFLSGSTCCTVLFDTNTIFVANCGDSRAVMCSYSPKSGIKITELSQDHKPGLPEEMHRIKQAGGRVETFKGPNNESLGPDRVWLMHEDSPGLAMSRSLGDNQAHLIGVIPDPGNLIVKLTSFSDVTKFDLTPDDKFIIIASDGVWEFLENEKVAEIVWPYFVKHSPEAAGNALVRAAAQKWKENDTVIDDITCIIIFMEID